MKEKTNEAKECTYYAKKGLNGEVVLEEREPVNVAFSDRIIRGETLLQEFRNGRKSMVPA